MTGAGSPRHEARIILNRVAFGLLLGFAVIPAADAQINTTPQPYIDLGPSSRPTGVPPNSGLLPGTPARPPGEYGAGTNSPVNPLPNQRLAPPLIRSDSVRVERERAIPPRTEQRPPGLPKSSAFCRSNPRNTRCLGGG